MDSYSVITKKWELTVNTDSHTVALTLLDAEQSDDGSHEMFNHDELVFLATHLANARHSIYVPPEPGSIVAPQPW